MNPQVTVRLAAALSLLLLNGTALSAYEPTYNEILVQKERLEHFCSMKDNYRRFDICERYESMKGKLPDRVEEIDIFRKIYGQKPTPQTTRP